MKKCFGVAVALFTLSFAATASAVNEDITTARISTNGFASDSDVEPTTIDPVNPDQDKDNSGGKKLRQAEGTLSPVIAGNGGTRALSSEIVALLATDIVEDWYCRDERFIERHLPPGCKMLWEQARYCENAVQRCCEETCRQENDELAAREEEELRRGEEYENCVKAQENGAKVNGDCEIEYQRYEEARTRMREARHAAIDCEREALSTCRAQPPTPFCVEAESLWETVSEECWLAAELSCRNSLGPRSVAGESVH